MENDNNNNGWFSKITLGVLTFLAATGIIALIAMGNTLSSTTTTVDNHTDRIKKIETYQEFITEFIRQNDADHAEIKVKLDFLIDQENKINGD